MGTLSQREEIKAHLAKFGSITPIEALNLYGCFRLASRIFELRDEGLNIETETIIRNGKKFAKYVKL